MAYTHEDLRQQLLEYVNTNPGWNWTQWNDETYWLGLHHKFDVQLVALQVMYQQKLKRIYRHYKEIFDILKYGVSESFIQATSEDDILDLKAVKQKVMRIARKLRGVNAEIAGRAAGFFGPGLTHDRTYVGTTYYIDLSAGNDGADGLGTGTAWLTIGKYTTVTVRSAGDIAYVRANTTQTFAASAACDEDGNKDSLISIIGCDSVTNDPWSDSSDVLPILDFNSGLFGIVISQDNFWGITRLSFKNSTYTGAALSIDRGVGCFVTDCEFIDNLYGSLVGPRGEAIFDGCTFSDNTTAGIYSSYIGFLRCAGCTFDAGAGGQLYGVYSTYQNGLIEFVDCSFGQSNAHGTADISVPFSSSIVHMRNCLHNDAFVVVQNGVIYSEDDDGVKGANVFRTGPGKITKDTGVTRVGGADSSAKMEPDADCGLYLPLTFNRNRLMDEPFKIWTAAALTTITVYIRSLGTWGTYPTASELYLEASHLNHATNATRTKVQSNDVLSHASNWVAFDVTFTPLQAGFVYLNVFLKKYEDAGDGCYVDIKPVVS